MHMGVLVIIIGVFVVVFTAFSYTLGVLAGLLLIIIGIYMVSCKSKEKERKRQAEQRKIEPDKVYGLKYKSGLGFTEDDVCSVELKDNKFIITSSAASYNLSVEKLICVYVNTREEIQKQLISSVGGAIGGYMLFGALGAMVGGAVKEKEIKSDTKYFVFAYNKDDTAKYISFEITGEVDKIRIANWQEMYKVKEQNKISIDL